MKKETLTTGNVYRALVRFAVPFMLADLLQVLYGATDLFVVGHFATTGDVTGVSIGSQVMGMLTQMLLGITTGTTVLLGQYFGAGKEEGMARTVGTSICLFGGIGAGLTVLLLLFRDVLVRMMHTPTEAVAATGAYLLICSLGTLFIVGYNVVSSILRGLGDSRTPLLFVAVACVINVVLDIILVKGAGMGAAGAALATVSAQGSSLIFAVYYLKKKGLGFTMRREDFRAEAFYIREILYIGAPSGIQSGLVSMSFLLITVVINQMGLIASAAVGVVEKLMEFLMLPSFAFGAAVSAMSAQNFGAGERKRAKSCMKGGILISLVFGIGIAVFCQFRGELFTGLFTKNQEVVYAAAQYLRTYALDCVMVAVIFNMNGFFSGCGHAVFAMVHSLAATFAVRVPVTLFFSRQAGVTLVKMGLAAPMSTLLSILLCAGYFVWLSRQPERLEINI